nr:MAG TPA: hypothetical protein [Caudoviricetes sp.]
MRFLQRLLINCATQTPIYDIFLYICTRKLSVNIKNQ